MLPSELLIILQDILKKNKTFLSGNPFYCSPQYLKTNVYQREDQSWSIGIIGIELLKGKNPYFGLSPGKTIFQITRQPPPALGPEFSKNCRDFVAQLLFPGSQSCIQHPFLLKSISQGQLSQFLYSIYEKDNRAMSQNESFSQVNQQTQSSSQHIVINFIS